MSAMPGTVFSSGRMIQSCTVLRYASRAISSGSRSRSGVRNDPSLCQPGSPSRTGAPFPSGNAKSMLYMKISPSPVDTGPSSGSTPGGRLGLACAKRSATCCRMKYRFWPSWKVAVTWP
jgi:hypothetical protein